MARSPQSTTTTPIENVFLVTGTVTTEVAAAVLVKTKALAALYNTPVSGQTAGTVIYGSIRVSDALPSVANNVTSWTVTVKWLTETVPA